jgi:integrase
MRLNLTDELVRRLKPAPRGKRYEVIDNVVTGLLVRVSTGNLGKTTKSFLVRSRVPGNIDFSKRKATTDPSRVNPTRRSLGLAGRLTVEQARATARRHFELISQGRDPRQVEQAELAERKAAERRQVRFAGVLEEWIKERVSTFRRRRQVTNECRNMLLPVLGERPLAQITTNDCRALVLDIAARSRFQAKAALRSLKTIFTWGIESGRYGLEVSPCHRIKAQKLIGTLNHRQRLLDDREIQCLWRATSELSDMERDYFRVLLMTGARRGDVSGMRAREIDWNRELWTIRQERFKTGQTHILPLSDELIGILKKRPCGTGNNDWLFSVDDSGERPMVGFHHAVTRLRRGMKKIDPEVAVDWVVHDFRRTVRSRLASLGISATVAEYVIGHKPKGIIGTYNLHRYEKETRAALGAWQRHLHPIMEGKTAKVVPLQRR